MNFEIHHLQVLMQELQAICQRTGRNAKDITVLAATKYANVQQINLVISAGVKVIGENRVQDAAEKIPPLLPVRKHLIGSLQTNKVKTAVRLFDCIESVDSLKLAQKIEDECAKIQKLMPILVEVNVANDPQKYGLHAQEVFEFLRQLKPYEHLRVEGLMAIVPYFKDPEEARHYFRKMKVLFDFCRKEHKSLGTLSMGMSHDYKVAVEEGATEVRIGSFLFRD